jgi:hypothetical protein
LLNKRIEGEDQKAQSMRNVEDLTRQVRELLLTAVNLKLKKNSKNHLFS